MKEEEYINQLKQEIEELNKTLYSKCKELEESLNKRGIFLIHDIEYYDPSTGPSYEEHYFKLKINGYHRKYEHIDLDDEVLLFARYNYLLKNI